MSALTKIILLLAFFFLAGCQSCRFLRTASLDLAAEGKDEAAYRAELGPPDFRGTLSELLNRLRNYEINVLVPREDGQYYRCKDYRDAVSCNIWQAVYPGAPITMYDPDWLDRYPYRNATCLFYDSRPKHQREAGYRTQSYVLVLASSKFYRETCVLKFHFPWDISDFDLTQR